MNIATGTISLALAMIVLVQSCAARFAGSLKGSEVMTQDAALGFLVALTMIMGGGLAFKLPRAAMVAFAITGFIAVIVSSGEYGDLRVWGYGLFVLAIMSFFASRKKKQASPART